MIYQYLLRPIIFRLYRGDAETAHEQTLRMLARVGQMRVLRATTERLFAYSHPELVRHLFGLRFPNPLGLAAGMDKDGTALPAWAALGFGFVEVGTVTWQPQPGNPRPRLFRLTRDGAIINRMGFNNQGASALAQRLAKAPPLPIPLGISIGKSKAAAPEATVEDYVASLRALFDYAGYIAINVSSPNTPGLRALQDREHLAGLLATLQRENRVLAAARETQPRPLLVKLAPDLSDNAIGELLTVCSDHAVAGLIAVNTTLERHRLQGTPAALAAETGGLSGRPLQARALEVVRLIARETAGRMPIIGVGGIASPADAQQMLEAGASLLQIYTGLVYAGPSLPGQILRGIR
ncbi:quinone-dependent dihydroorotate dehydrogenase [Candidatus Viridilinea mediisalina]|uniref:Dihydroorotate dehydrogenase (quinone) n=1 Tax=Candidatus Viridilinea mediisalina TaxID=2024553 RepID=A0A2A6RJ88_9CHLR|nr:quinone-dependent dihydroorotate dehydrogenase [Candidatus Viridilinea mediisalina]PDW03137.1 dihydroorotate dehydrogenase (quinone) [Candidatus Viridilinea mediisalina]